jgi:hypothetical protein
MKSRFGPSVVAIVVAVIWFIPVHIARAADDDKLSLTITPYAWLASVAGTVGARGFDVPATACFTEILSDSDSIIGGFGRVELRKGAFALYADGGGMKIGVNNIAPVGNLDAKFDLAMVDFGGMYRVGTWPIGGNADGPTISLDGLAGGRYTYLNLEFDPRRLKSRSRNDDWVDPLIGGQVMLNLNRQWALTLRGDIGGFGVASDFAWGAVAMASYRFPIGSKVDGSVFLGYKAIGDDYTNDNKTRFKWDEILHGPMFGMEFTF